jgi:hypothetical protein
MEFKNHMAEVAAIFGKKLGESFSITVTGDEAGCKCMFTDNDVFIWDERAQEWRSDHGETLHDLLVGSVRIYEA